MVHDARMHVYQHPSVPWVTIYPLQDGSFIVKDTRTQRDAHVATELQVHEFAAEAARASGYYGAGDAVAAVAGRLGFKKCTPCARRQARLNAMVPHFWRR
jgi:hypothetical protein